MISGPGYRFENGRHLFVPADAAEGAGTVELTYHVDGGEATALLTLVERPNAAFEVLDASGTTVDQVCVDHDPLLVSPTEPGGTFTAFAGGEELTNVFGTIGANQIVFIPANVPQEAELPTEVVILHSLPGNYCDGQATVDFIVFPIPNAAFSFANNATAICVDEGTIELIPVEDNGVFTAHINNSGPISDAIIQTAGSSFFDPGVVALEPGEEAVVTIRHTILSDGGCDDVVEQDITVSLAPSVNFEMPQAVCQNEGPVNLVPSIDGGTFVAEVSGAPTPANLIEGNQLFPDRIAMTDQVVVTVTYTLNVGPCVSDVEHQMVILPAPEADFDANFIFITNPTNAQRELFCPVNQYGTSTRYFSVGLPSWRNRTIS